MIISKKNISIFDKNYHNFIGAGINNNKAIINYNKINNINSYEDVYNLIVKYIKNDIVNKQSFYKFDEEIHYNNYNYYTNDTMIIDYHTKIFKCVLDIDLKYDNEHININKIDEIKKDNLSIIYDKIINEFINLIKEYFNYNKELLEEKYYNYILELFDYTNNEKQLENNIYKYIYSNKCYDYNFNKKYYNENATNIHLYFPLIFISKNDFRYLRVKLIHIMNKLYPNYIWNSIIDINMDHIGFRLLYTNKPLYKIKDNKIVYFNQHITEFKSNYYVINYNKSTLKIKEKLYYDELFITSMQSPYEKSFLTIKDKYLNEYNNIDNIENELNDKYKNNKNNKENNKNNNKNNNKTLKEKIKLNDVKDINITTEINKCFNLINSERNNKYIDWFYITCLCHTYNLYSFSIEYSKKSYKFDNNSIDTINNTFTHKILNNKEIHFNTLFYWIIKDNKLEYKDLINFLENNNIDIDKLNEELISFNCDYQLKKYFISNISINDLIKLNIKESLDIINNKNFNYLEVNNDFINDNDFNKLKDYNNICLISPVGSGKTTFIKKIIKYWNDNYIDNILIQYPNIIYLDDYNLNILIKSNFWINKNEKKINNFINGYNEFNKNKEKNNNIKNIINLRILFISSLISLGDKIYIDLNEYNIKNYNNLFKKDYNKYNSLIISLEQLYLIINYYDVIIIDEITSFINRFLSKTNNNLTMNYNKLLNLCKNSNHIILSDALFREDTFLLTTKLFNLNNKPSIFYYNNYKKCNNKIINNYFYNKNYSDNDNILNFITKQNIKDKIINKKSNLICCDSVKNAKFINDYFKDIYKNDDNYFNLITKDIYDKDFVNNCNETFNNKTIIYSPKITYGIDIQINYDKIFGIYKGKSINSYLILQQFSRSRKCNNINLLTLFNDDNNKKIYSFDMFKYFYLKNIKRNKGELIFNLLNNNELINQMDELLNMNEDLINKHKDIIDFLNIVLYNKYFDYITYNNKLQCLKLLSEYQGYTFNSFYLDNLDKYNKKYNNNDIDEYKNYQEINLSENYNLLNGIINNDLKFKIIDNKDINYYKELQKYLNSLISKKINKNRIIKSSYLFNKEFSEIERIFNKKEDLLNIINKNENNLNYVYKILINLNKEFNLNKFELLKEYNNDNLIKFINDNKDNINKLYTSKDNNKDKLKKKSFDNLLKEVNNNKMNKKFNMINGLYLFNQFILDCYKYIDKNLINNKEDKFTINKIRYNKQLSFNNTYINNMKEIYNINKNDNIIIKI